jgi:hypothetical protein
MKNYLYKMFWLSFILQYVIFIITYLYFEENIFLYKFGIVHTILTFLIGFFIKISINNINMRLLSLEVEIHNYPLLIIVIVNFFTLLMNVSELNSTWKIIYYFFIIILPLSIVKLKFFFHKV